MCCTRWGKSIGRVIASAWKAVCICHANAVPVMGSSELTEGSSCYDDECGSSDDKLCDEDAKYCSNCFFICEPRAMAYCTDVFRIHYCLSSAANSAFRVPTFLDVFCRNDDNDVDCDWCWWCCCFCKLCVLERNRNERRCARHACLREQKVLICDFVE